ncbi:MAG: response regulator [Saprospiraceae bacterium]|nr:response regulator [Saprospiraceae bacterium]
MRVLLCGLGSILNNALDYRLRKYGYRVTAARDANDALSRIHAGQADIIVSSIHIQGFKLQSFIGLIREDLGHSIPIILVAEIESEVETILEGMEAGADDFVTFPFKPAELVMRIKLLLYRYVHY